MFLPIAFLTLQRAVVHLHAPTALHQRGHRVKYLFTPRALQWLLTLLLSSFHTPLPEVEQERRDQAPRVRDPDQQLRPPDQRGDAGDGQRRAPDPEERLLLLLRGGVADVVPDDLPALEPAQQDPRDERERDGAPHTRTATATAGTTDATVYTTSSRRPWVTSRSCAEGTRSGGALEEGLDAEHVAHRRVVRVGAVG